MKQLASDLLQLVVVAVPSLQRFLLQLVVVAAPLLLQLVAVAVQEICI
jgi:hypothetical protein